MSCSLQMSKMNLENKWNIYTMKKIQQISNRKQQPLCLLFVDLSAVDHQQLVKDGSLTFLRFPVCSMAAFEFIHSNYPLCYETIYVGS